MKQLSTFSKISYSTHILACIVFLIFTACSKTSRRQAPTEAVFRFAMVAKVSSLDPHITHDVYNSQIQSLIFENLYEFDFIKRPYELIPGLAAKMPEWNADKRSFKVQLKKGIYFHDDPCFQKTGGKGRELTADDVVYTYERIAAPKFISPSVGEFIDKIVGLKEFHDGKSKSISGIRALDKYTVEFQLKKHLPRFIYNLVGTSTAIVPKEWADYYKDDVLNHAVGTGPYKIQEFDGSYKVVAVKNPNYSTLTALDGSKLPKTDKVIAEVIIEEQPAWLRFLNGEFEISAIPKDSHDSAIAGGKLSPELQKLNIRLDRKPRSDVTTLIFNTEDPVWKKKELRQAVALSLDIEKIIAVQYAGEAIRANSLIDPSQYGYDPQFKSKWSSRNIEKAKELIKKAGYNDSHPLPPISFLTSSSTTSRQFTELLSRQLAEAGLTLQPEVVTWQEMVKKLQEKNFTLVSIGYASETPDADSAFSQYHSKFRPRVNVANYLNPTVDKLIDEIEMMDNSPARLKKIEKVKQLVDEDMPYIPIVHRIGNQLAQPWVKNYSFMESLFLGRFIKYLEIETKTDSHQSK